MKKSYNPEEFAEIIANYCYSFNKKLLFIGGNGGSGKTELSRIIANFSSKYGKVNVIHIDDFIVDTNLRNSAVVNWTDNDQRERAGRYTTSFEASYFLQNVKAILYNLKNGNNYYHRSKKSDTYSLLYADAIITIVEGLELPF